MALTLPFKDQWEQGANVDEQTGYGNAGTGENNVPATGGATVSWSTPGNIVSEFSNGNAQIDADETDTIPYLRASNFGWDTIPAGATIVGVEAQIIVAENEGDRWDEDEVRLAWDASAASLSADDASGNKASATTLVVGTNEFGGPTDMWGTSLVAADIDSDFGLVFKPLYNTTGADSRCQIDCVRLRVYYTVTGGGNVRFTQAYAEVIADDESTVRLTQVYAEVIGGVTAGVTKVYPDGPQRITVIT